MAEYQLSMRVSHAAEGLSVLLPRASSGGLGAFILIELYENTEITPIDGASAFVGATTGTYSATGLPIGLAIDAASGLITGTPLGLQGERQVSIRLTNFGGQTAEAMLLCNVVERVWGPIAVNDTVGPVTAVGGSGVHVIDLASALDGCADQIRLNSEAETNGLSVDGTKLSIPTDRELNLIVEVTAINPVSNVTFTFPVVVTRGSGVAFAQSSAPAIAFEPFGPGDVTYRVSAPYNVADFTFAPETLLEGPVNLRLPRGIDVTGTGQELSITGGDWLYDGRRREPFIIRRANGIEIDETYTLDAGDVFRGVTLSETAYGVEGVRTVETVALAPRTIPQTLVTDALRGPITLPDSPRITIAMCVAPSGGTGEKLFSMRNPGLSSTADFHLTIGGEDDLLLRCAVRHGTSVGPVLTRSARADANGRVCLIASVELGQAVQLWANGLTSSRPLDAPETPSGFALSGETHLFERAPPRDPFAGEAAGFIWISTDEALDPVAFADHFFAEFDGIYLPRFLDAGGALAGGIQPTFYREISV